MKTVKIWIYIAGTVLGVMLFAQFSPIAQASIGHKPEQDHDVYLPIVAKTASPFAGIVYSAADSLWLIDTYGEHVFLIDQPNGRISPDGRKVVYWFAEGEGADDIWLADLVTYERTNLTQTDDRAERYAEWWPAQPNWIFFGSGDSGGYPGGGGYGLPSAIDIAGNNYLLLDDRGGGYPAFSHDGQKIAYTAYNEFGSFNIINHWGAGTEIFDPAEYGINVNSAGSSPTWSPDDQKMVWKVAGEWGPEDSWRHAVAIFDPETMTARFLHEYELLGGAGCGRRYHAWQPNGEWLAAVTQAEELSPLASGLSAPQAPEGVCGPNLWLLNTTSQDKHYMGRGTNPIWGPDGKSLAYTTPSGMSGDGGWVLDIDTWETTQILPPGATIVDWLALDNSENNQVYLPLLQITRPPAINSLYLGAYEEQNGIFVTNEALQRYFEDGEEKTHPYVGLLTYSDGGNIHPYDFNNLDAPEQLFSVDEQVIGITNFALEAGNEQIFASVILSGTTPYSATNKVYGGSLTTNEFQEVWMNEVGSGSAYAGYQGSAHIDLVQENFVVMRIMPCYACESFSPGNAVILNTAMGTEKVFGEVGNVAIDVETNTVSYQYLAPIQAPCDPSPGCEDGYRTIYEPAGEVFTEELP